MKLLIPIEFDDHAEDGELTLETCENAEFADVRLLGPMDEHGTRSTMTSFSASVSDLAAIVAALEKIKDDVWEREEKLK